MLGRIIQLRTGMKVTVQILQCDGQSEKVLHAFTHSAALLRVVADSLKAVFNSDAWPKEADAFRVVSNDGTELCRWPHNSDGIRSLENESAAA
jgi:hypothetical protein